HDCRSLKMVTWCISSMKMQQSGRSVLKRMPWFIWMKADTRKKKSIPSVFLMPMSSRKGGLWMSNNDHVKAMAKEIEQLRYKHDIHTIFQDWVEIMALSLSNACDKEQYAKREERYMQIIGKYTKEE